MVCGGHHPSIARRPARSALPCYALDVNRAASLLLLSILAVACATEEGTGASGDPGPMPPASCDPGTRPEVGKTECQPVGVSTAECAEGFARSEDGWACEAITAADGCTGVKRAKLGDAKCVADDDCDAPFPPAGVDKVLASGDDVSAAIASLPSGSTIALDTGVYQAITVEKDVTIVGRCAEKVRVRGPGTRGIYVVGELKVNVRSLAIEGFDGGLVGAYGPTVTGSKLVLSGNKLSVVAGESTVKVDHSVMEGGGVSAQLAAKLTLEDVEIRDASPAISAYEDDTEVTLKRSIAHDAGESRTTKMIHAWGGAKVLVDESLVRTQAGGLAAVGNALPGTPVDATKARGGIIRTMASELRQVGFDRDNPWVTIAKGGTFEIERTSVLHESVFAFMVGDAESTFVARGSTIRSGPTDGIFRAALFVTDGASADLEDTAVVGAIQSAVTAGHSGSRLSLSRSFVTGTVFRGPGPNAEEGGAGIAVGVADEATLVMKDSAVSGSEQFGLMADGAGRAEIERTFFDATRASPEHGGGGDAVVITGGAILAMSTSVVRGSEDAAVMAVGGVGIVDESRFVNNRVGIHLTATRLVETNERPAEQPPEELVLVKPIFVQTSEARVRTAEITLPGYPKR